MTSVASNEVEGSLSRSLASALKNNNLNAYNVILKGIPPLLSLRSFRSE